MTFPVLGRLPAIVSCLEWGTNGAPRGAQGMLARNKVTPLDAFSELFSVIFLILLKEKGSWILCVCVFLT